jgi:sodium/hydrogen antiporter
LGKLGFFLPRTLSRAFTSPGEESARSSIDRPRAPSLAVLRERRKRNNTSRASRSSQASASTGPLVRLGGRVIRAENSGAATPGEVEVPSTPQTPPAIAKKRTIRFPEDPPPLSLDEPGPSSTTFNEVDAAVVAEVTEGPDTIAMAEETRITVDDVEKEHIF